MTPCVRLPKRFTKSLSILTGRHHVNLQPQEYWVSHLKARGCLWLQKDTSRIRAIAAAEGARYLANSGLIFVNKTRYEG